MQRICFTALACLSIFTLVLVCGCDNKPAAEKETQAKSDEGGHSHSDALAWPKKDIEHEGFVISLGHHGNHFHAGDPLEPAVAISKDGKDIGDATMTCQLMDGETAIGEPVAMVFEPKTEEEPAHYAQGELKFPGAEKMYQVHFVVQLPGVDTPWKDSIDVRCGHKPRMVPVSGKVSIDGKPLLLGSIAFIPNTPSTDRRPGGAALDDSGSYSVTSFEPNDGLPLGHYTVVVSAVDAPERYKNQNTSGLTAEITKETESLDFELTRKGDKRDKSGDKKKE